jgi:hypothetical protein
MPDFFYPLYFLPELNSPVNPFRALPQKLSPNNMINIGGLDG